MYKLFRGAVIGGVATALVGMLALIDHASQCVEEPFIQMLGGGMAFAIFGACGMYLRRH